jgi:hypothetical protein
MDKAIDELDLQRAPLDFQTGFKFEEHFVYIGICSYFNQSRIHNLLICIQEQFS